MRENNKLFLLSIKAATVHTLQSYIYSLNTNSFMFEHKIQSAPRAHLSQSRSHHVQKLMMGIKAATFYEYMKETIEKQGLACIKRNKNKVQLLLQPQLKQNEPT